MFRFVSIIHWSKTQEELVPIFNYRGPTEKIMIYDSSSWIYCARRDI